MKKIIIFLTLLFLIPIAVATISVTRLAPAEFTIQNSTTVVYTWNVNNTLVFNNDFNSSNCTIYTRMNNSVSLNATITDFAAGNLTNNSQSITYITGDRVWWIIGCKGNATEGDTTGEVNTTQRIFDVDTDYYKLKLGDDSKLNFSLDTGDIQTAGDMTLGDITSFGSLIVQNVTLANVSVVQECSASENGRIVYNASTHIMYACNSTAWRALW